MTHLIIIGAGGFGLEVATYAKDLMEAQKANFVSIKGFLDDTKAIGQKHGGYPVLGTTDVAIDTNALYVIAVGAPAARKKLAEKIATKTGIFTTILHPLSYSAATAKTGPGTIMAPFSFAGPEAKIGNHCVLNIYASAGHESTLGDYSVLSPYSTVNGSGVLGDEVFLGSHACITAQIHIGTSSKVSAGAAVYNNVPAGSIVIGNPARHRAN